MGRHRLAGPRSRAAALPAQGQDKGREQQVEPVVVVDPATLEQALQHPGHLRHEALLWQSGRGPDVEEGVYTKEVLDGALKAEEPGQEEAELRPG